MRAVHCLPLQLLFLSQVLLKPVRVYPFYKTNTAIHHLIKFLKNNEERPDCKKIKEKYPLRRDTIKEFKEKFPLDYKRYKEEMQKYYWLQEKM